MHVEGKQTVQVIAAPSKLNTISPIVKRSQRADDYGLRRKVKKKYEIIFEKLLCKIII